MIEPISVKQVGKSSNVMLKICPSLQNGLFYFKKYAKIKLWIKLLKFSYFFR